MSSSVSSGGQDKDGSQSELGYQLSVSLRSSVTKSTAEQLVVNAVSDESSQDDKNSEGKLITDTEQEPVT